MKIYDTFHNNLYAFIGTKSDANGTVTYTSFSDAKKTALINAKGEVEYAEQMTEIAKEQYERIKKMTAKTCDIESAPW